MKRIAVFVPGASRVRVFCLAASLLVPAHVSRSAAGMADAPSCFKRLWVDGRHFCIDHEDYSVFIRGKEVDAETAEIPSDASPCEQIEIAQDIERGLSAQIRDIEAIRAHALSSLGDGLDQAQAAVAASIEKLLAGLDAKRLALTRRRAGLEAARGLLAPTACR